MYRHPPSRLAPGRHELGQNFLVDPAVPAALAGVVSGWAPRPLLELGAGDGALTAALLELGRPVTAVELDPRRVQRLRHRFGDRVRVHRGDLVTERLDRPVDVVSNVPFGLTTPLLRRLLRAPRWSHALLLLQWEVARKRAAVGGTTQLTALWWPWFAFGLRDRVPARASGRAALGRRAGADRRDPGPRPGRAGVGPPARARPRTSQPSSDSASEALRWAADITSSTGSGRLRVIAAAARPCSGTNG